MSTERMAPGFKLAPHTLGDYVLVSEIGRGSSGQVYAAWDQARRRRVAVKVHDPASGDAPGVIHAEALLTSSLDHPGIPEIYRSGPDAGRSYFAMRYIDGEPLAKRLGEGGFAPGVAVELVLDLAEILGHCHARGVVHHDIKPSNILIDDDGRTHLIDFGAAAADDADMLIGTPPYLAAEYIDGAAYDAGCDVFSLGVVLYECLAGRRRFPFDRMLRGAHLVQFGDGQARRLSDRVAVDPELETIVHTAIAPRGLRYASVDAFARALRRHQARRLARTRTFARCAA